MINRKIIALALLAGFMGFGCKPRTPAEKVQDKIEDVTHDAGQAIKKAGDRVKDAGNN